jgi:uncharacterized membrane protein YeaQ/YmgE (transglycosylase-associated protein family)
LLSAARRHRRVAEGGGMLDFLWFLLIGLAAGWLAGMIVKGGGFGLIGDLVVGVIGALLGGFLFGLLNVTSVGLLGSLITATVGAVICSPFCDSSSARRDGLSNVAALAVSSNASENRHASIVFVA